MLPRLKWVSDLTENPKFVKSNEKFPQQKLFQEKPNPAQQKAPPRRVLFRLKLSFSFVLPYSFDTSVTPGAAVLPAQLWRQIALIPESSQIPITSRLELLWRWHCSHIPSIPSPVAAHTSSCLRAGASQGKSWESSWTPWPGIPLSGALWDVSAPRCVPGHKHHLI